MTYQNLLRAGLACLLLSFSINSVRAQDPPTSPTQIISPEKQALIKELLELASSKKTIDAMLKAQAEQMDKQLPDISWQAVADMKELKSLTPEQREELRLKVVSNSLRSGRRVYELIQEKIDFNKLIEDVSLPLYDKYLTESELRDLVVFYKSPTGKKVIEVMPNLVAESMTRTAEVILPRFTEIMRQIQQEETQRMEKEIRADVKNKQKSAKPASRTPRKRRRG
jgi:hypothetical protein